jgi:hypothetical protein
LDLSSFISCSRQGWTYSFVNKSTNFVQHFKKLFYSPTFIVKYLRNIWSITKR